MQQNVEKLKRSKLFANNSKTVVSDLQEVSVDTDENCGEMEEDDLLLRDVEMSAEEDESDEEEQYEPVKVLVNSENKTQTTPGTATTATKFPRYL